MIQFLLMIDALFGSKTRVKLLQLFLNNPEKSFYVREITRLIDEQINSVRRELSNMLNVGIIVSDTAENKLYYAVNENYEHYRSLRDIFVKSDSPDKPSAKNKAKNAIKPWVNELVGLPGLRLAVTAGALVPGSASSIDLLMVGSVPNKKIASVVKKIEKYEGRDLNYAVLSYDDFYYRLSVRDKFVAEIISGKFSTIVDTEGILN